MYTHRTIQSLTNRLSPHILQKKSSDTYTIKNNMVVISCTFYEQLVIFYRGLCVTFEDIEQIKTNFVLLNNSREKQCDTLFLTLTANMDQTMLRSFSNKNADSFFQENDPFIAFIGGRDLFSRLSEDEQDVYWSSTLGTIIHNGIILRSLYPKREKIGSIVSLLGNCASMNITDILSTLSSKPEIFGAVLSMVDGKNGLQDMLSLIKTIASCSQAMNQSQSENTDNCPHEPQDIPVSRLDSDYNNTVNDNMFNEVNPSDVFQKTHATTSESKDKPETSGISSILDMCSNLLENDMDGIQKEMEDIKIDGDTPSVLASVCSSILEHSSSTGQDNPFGNIMTSIQSMVDQIKPGDTSDDPGSLSSLLGSIQQLG